MTLAVYGEDDYRIMLKHNIQLIEHVDQEGKLKQEVTPWAGMYILKVNPLVNEDLMNRGLIYHSIDRNHSVPVCYRCETKLYHAPIPAWFINIQKNQAAAPLRKRAHQLVSFAFKRRKVWQGVRGSS